jgi:hypothetical protein
VLERPDEARSAQPACYVTGMRRVLVVAFLGVTTTAAASVRGSVTPPPEWIEDPAAGAELRAKTGAGFFGGRTDVECAVYRSPIDRDGAKLAVQIMHASAVRLTPDEAIDALSKRLESAKLISRRVEPDGRVVADHRLETETHVTQIKLQAMRDARDGLHVMTIACTEPSTGTACASAIESARLVDEARAAGNESSLGYWFKIGGGSLIGLGLLGWFFELRRRRR